MDPSGDRRARPAGARASLALGALVIVMAGVLVATQGATFPELPGARGAGAVAAIAPVAPVAVTCASVGPYRPPEPGSVGLPAGTSTCASGPITVRTAGAVLDGWDVRGGVVVDAPDVVVRRSRITGDGSTEVGVRTTAAGWVRIEDTTITGAFTVAAVAGDRWSGERLDIVAVSGDGAVLGRGSRLRASAVHDLAPAPGQEPRGVVVHGPDDVLVEDNHVDLGPVPGTAVLLDLPSVPAGTPAPMADLDAPAVVLRGNTVGGGRVTVRQEGDTGPEVWLVANRFQRDAVEAPLWVARSVVRENNTYTDGGRLPDR